MAVSFVICLGIQEVEGATPPAINAAPVQKEGLIAHYDFQEGSGTVLKDKSGNNNMYQVN